MKIVTVRIGKDGKSTLDLDGFNGSGCSAVSQDFAGTDRVDSETHKPEFHECGQKQDQQQ